MGISHTNRESNQVANELSKLHNNGIGDCMLWNVLNIWYSKIFHAIKFLDFVVRFLGYSFSYFEVFPFEFFLNMF